MEEEVSYYREYLLDTTIIVEETQVTVQETSSPTEDLDYYRSYLLD